jgi:hypothetical protein
MEPSMNRLAALSAVLLLTAGGACMPTVGGLAPDDPTGPDAGTYDPGPDASCPNVEFTPTPVTPSIQLLLDRSGSMNNSVSGTNMSRYAALREALVGTTGVIAELQDTAYFGASLYTSDSPCPRLYNTANRQLSNLSQVRTLIDSQSPGGQTPTPGAIDQTVALFAANPPPAGSPPIIILATDGLPNSCSSSSDTSSQSVTAARNAYNAGIRTYVLGIAGVNNSFLQNMANAGVGVQQGQPNAPYYTATTAADLKTAFQTIINGVASCELNLTGAVDPQQAQDGSLTLDGQPLTYGVDWELVNSTTIRLLGAACDTLKASPNPMLNASFPCGSIIL